jgi:urease accessory protein UreH
MELDHLLVKEDLDLALEHQEVDAVHLTAGPHGFALVAVAETVCMELQAVAVAEEEQVEEDLVAVEQEAHRQLITQVVKAWTEQVQVAEEITTLVETDKKEVLA